MREAADSIYESIMSKLIGSNYKMTTYILKITF